jgi:hypothetical protein
MNINNPWVGYLDRSFSNIKASVLKRLRVLAPEITDYSESNPLVILVSIFSGITEMLNYYIDSQAREVFLATARKFDSLIKLSRLVNYRIKASISASVDLTFTTYDSDGETIVVNSTPIVIPMNTAIATSSGIQYLTTREAKILPGFFNVSVPARQRVIHGITSLGVSTGAADQQIALPLDFEDGTLYVQVGGVTWDYKEHFGFSLPTSQHFTVIIGLSYSPYLLFGDNIHGAIPTAGATIEIAYRSTSGIRGRVPAQTLTEIVSTLTIPSGETQIAEIGVTNINASASGLDVESTELLRKSIPLSIRTLDRAVTEQDYNDIAKLAPSVDKAKVFFNCGKKVKIYVAPIGGGIASLPMMADILAFMNVRKMITTFIDIQAAGETYIGMDIVATSRFRINTQLTVLDMQKALVDAYSSVNSDINKAIRISDIYALLDNLERVDYLQLVNIYWVPYARPYDSDLQLDWDRKTLLGSTTKILWQLVYNGSTFQLFRAGVFITAIAIGVQYTHENLLEITINSLPAGIASGNRWTFYTYPVNQDLQLDDYTVPRVSPDLQYIDILVNEGNG